MDGVTTLPLKTDFHVCGVCGIRFPLVEEYLAHKESGCKVLSTLGMLNAQTVQNKPAARPNNYCDICKKELCNENYKKIHMKKVHGEDRAGKVFRPTAQSSDPTINMRNMVVTKFMASLSSDFNLDLDRLIENAKMGDKLDLENAVNTFLKTYKVKVTRKKGRHGRKSPYLHPGTRTVYWNFLRNWIREYSDGLVELVSNPNSHNTTNSLQNTLSDGYQEYPWVQNPEVTQSGKQEDVEQYVDVESDHIPEVFKPEFPAKCQHCHNSTDVYLTEASLEAHCQVSHPYQCPACPIMISTQEKMKSHFMIKHPDIEVHLCNQCTVVFLSFHDRAGHDCKNFLLQGAATLLEELLLKVKAWSPSLCPFCPTSQTLFQTPQSYESHCLASHPGQCPICPKSFRYLGNKRNHFRTDHSNLNPNYCHSCPAVYLNWELLPNEHKCASTPMVLQSDDPPWWDGCLYTCNKCGEGFPESSDMRTHIYYEHLSQTKRKALLRHESKRIRKGITEHKYGNVNVDYKNLKTTYWKCRLCAMKGRGKAIILRKRSVITAHLRTGHKNMSIQEYEKKLLNMRASSIGCFTPANQVSNLRFQTFKPAAAFDMENSPIDVEDMTTDMWKCELCQLEFDNQSEHVSQQHGISLAEYFHLAKEDTETEELGSDVKENMTEKTAEAKPWWDGCIYKCNHCGVTLPDSFEIQKHIYYTHHIYKHGKNQMAKIHRDFEAFKITYWHCKLCALNKKGHAGKGIVQRSHATIKAHLRSQHDLSSVEEYEAKVRDPAALRAELEKAPSPKPEPRRSQRQNQKSTENFKEVATGTTTCKICKKEGIKRLEKHLSENHNITSLEEYEEVAMYVPKSATPEKPTPQPLLNLTASATTAVNQMGVHAMIPTHVLGADVDRVTSLQGTQTNTGPPKVPRNHIYTDFPEEYSSKHVGDVPMNTWKCELCQSDFEDPSDHVSRQHGISLAEYTHLVKEDTEKKAQTYTGASGVSTDLQNLPRDSNNCEICQKGLFINEHYKETHMKTMHGIETNKSLSAANDVIAQKVYSSFVERIDEESNMDSLDNLDVKVEDFIGDPLANMESFIHIKDDNELPQLFLPDN